MEDHALTLICNFFNSILSNFFSSFDSNFFSYFDSIIFINSDILNSLKFQQLFGTDSANGFLLIANSLILGISIFYILRFSISHLIYSKIDSPSQFFFKCVIFTACMSSSLWICEKIIEITFILSDLILKLGNSVTGYEITFSNLVNLINSILYSNPQNFDLFSFDGFLKLANTICLIYILFSYSIRYFMCKIYVLISPFAFISLICNSFDGFFKGWIKNFIELLFMQVFISIVLSLGFCMNFYVDDTHSKLMYFAILFIIANCKVSVKQLFSHIYESSKNILKDLF